MNGQPRNLRIAPAGSANGQKADPNDPQARKLVYNAYREMLSKKHAASNVIIDSAPQELVTKDEGVGARVESMMRQQSELKGGNMNAGGPPPPPPPPPIPGVIPTSRLPSELSSMSQPPPAALASAMMKDRKPFTYTPGGLDLSEIRSPRMQRRLYRNAQSEGVKPSPLAQQPPPGQPNSAASQAAALGRAVQVLPMPGVGMGQPQPQPQPKEPPKVKKSVCGPAPPPPPFVVTSENSFTMPVSSPISSIPSTISSPPISSSPTSPAAPQPQLAKDLGPSIPVAPPLPTQTFAARRGSLICASSPPASPLVSTEPYEPSPPPLPPPQAVRVPVTPPILLEPLSPPTVLHKEPVMPIPQTITQPIESSPPPEAPVFQNEVPEENSFTLPEPSQEIPQFTSTPVQIFKSKKDEHVENSPVEPLFNSIHEPSPVPEEPQREPSLEQPLFIQEPNAVEMVSSPEPVSPPQMRSREPSAPIQMPIKELSPYYMPVVDMSPSPATIKEPSPMEYAVNNLPDLASQIGLKEPSPARHVKEPSPVVQISAAKPSPIIESPFIKPSLVKEPSPIKQAVSKEPSPASPKTQQLNNIANARYLPPEEPSESEPPVIFSPLPVKEMPLKEPTPVRQILRELTPIRQATLEKPVITEPAAVITSPPIAAPQAAPVKQAPTSGTTALRQVPVHQAGVKRHSSLPEAPFLSNARPQQQMSLPEAPFLSNSRPQQQQQPSVILKTNIKKPMPVNQPVPQKSIFPKPIMPIKPVPIKTGPEPVKHNIPVRMPSPPPTLGATAAPSVSKGTRLVRQASLPTKPSSPQVSPPTAQLGSLYIPPLTSEELNNAGPMSPSQDRSPRRSPTTGLHRAPLPWMSAYRREPSPPPLFLQHAQQTFRRFQPQQSRFTRQSSLGPEISPTEPLAQTLITAQNNVRQQQLFQRQQSLPPPQRLHESLQPQPVRMQTQQQQPQPQFQQQQPQPQTQQPQPQLQQLQPQSQQPQPRFQLPQPQYQQSQPRFQQPQPQFQQPQPQYQQPQPQQPQYQAQHQYQQPRQQQPYSQPIRIQQPQFNQQPRVIPIQVQQTSQQKHKPRERIIPIMIEGESPPRETAPPTAPNMTLKAPNTNTNAANERFIPIRIDGNSVLNNMQHGFQQPQPQRQQQRPLLQPQPTWANSPGKGLMNHPVTTLSGGQSGAFLPYNSSSSLSSSSTENVSTNNNPLDALHQMQQSLAQLNSGLENNQPNQNGNGVDQADFGPPTQSRSFRVLQNVLDHHDTAGSDDEISNYMQAPVPQAQTSVSHGGPKYQQPMYNQSHYQQPQHIPDQGKSTNISQSQHPTYGMPLSPNANESKICDGPKTSRFFRLLQTITDTLPDGAEPQGPIHIPTMRQHVQQPSQYHQLQPNQCQPQNMYQQHSGVNNASNAEQSAPEPKKYMGGNIPSRSFRMLQAMTGSDDVAGPGQSDL